MLKITNLHKTFNAGTVNAKTALAGLNLEIKEGDFVTVIGGGIVYYIVYNFVILLGLKTDYLKMLSAVIVALFLGIPYLKAEHFTKQKAPQSAPQQSGGKHNA